VERQCRARARGRCGHGGGLRPARRAERRATIKQDAYEIVDSLVAEEIGKLPDRSVPEVLPRVVGVSINRQAGDDERFPVAAAGVNIGGLNYVRSELKRREAFAANGGRSLGWGDIPPELMAGVDVCKNPSAEQTEGGIAGLGNLRTALPFDFIKPGYKDNALEQSIFSSAARYDLQVSDACGPTTTASSMAGCRTSSARTSRSTCRRRT
jgi:outer membrane receptor protein involved in Fe transport